MIAGEPLGVRRLHHACRLAAEGCGELLHAHLPVRGHDAADRLAVHLGHQRLQHAGRVFFERLRRLQSDAFGTGIVVIAVNGEDDAGLCESLRRPVVFDMV